MELLLNLAWASLAGLMFIVWLRLGARGGADRRVQFVALALLAMILFPVVSVTDDLQAAQNPAEVDCCVRRVHEAARAHVPLSGAAAPPLLAFARLIEWSPINGIVENRQTPRVDSPAMTSIQSRPPPAV
jgi:hypothetical protein